jgi:hypothetical protein
MTEWILITMAALGGWDILRRLLPVKVPPVAGKIILVLIAWALIRYGTSIIVYSLGVPGTLILVSRILNPEPHDPWGPYLAEAYRSVKYDRQKKQSHNQSRVGHRLPKL